MLPISLAFAAAAALLNIWLSIRCGQIRTREKINHGDGGNPLLMRRMRAHANFIEYTPIVLILFVLIEGTMGPSIWLWAVAALYIAGRVLHGIGMDAEQGSRARMVGVLITLLVTVGLALTAAYASYRLSGSIDAPASAGEHA